MQWVERSMIDIALKAARNEIRSGAVQIPGDCKESDNYRWYEVRGLIYWWCANNGISSKRRGELCNLISVAVRTALDLKYVWNLEDKHIELAKIIALTILTTIEYFKPVGDEKNQRYEPNDFNFKSF